MSLSPRHDTAARAFTPNMAATDLDGARRPQNPPRKGRSARVLSMSVALTALLALGGCSSIPDYANPVSWYEGTVDTVGGWFSDDDAPRIEQGTASDPGGDTRDQYPNLASVPERPTATGAEEAAAIREGLVADRSNARYSEASVAPTGYPPVAPPPPRTVPATAADSTTAATTTAATTTAAAPAAPAPAPAQQTSAPAPRSSGDESALWPNRPAPDSRIRTGITNANVGGGTSRVATPTSTSRAVTAPQPSASATSRTETRDAAPARQAPAQQAQTSQAPASQVAAVTTDLSALDAPAPSNSGAYQQALANYGQTAGAPAGYGQSAYSQGGYLPSGQSYLAGTVYFGHGSAGLSGEEKSQIRGLARQANEAGAGVVVLGHASSRTGDMPLDVHDRVNFDVSKLRAESVARALIEGGLPADRVFIEALSDSAPAFYEIMPSGEAGNRRAEILFVY
jgi:outer membrane protein OmpA-like peptidoglycan-associated protein